VESKTNKQKAIISACLIGRKCRYDGTSLLAPDLIDFKHDYELIPVCPEVDGGLGVPRPKAWIKSGTGADVLDSKTIIINEHGLDVTAQFISGAEHTLTQAKKNNVHKAILKAKSPSCGKGQVYNYDKLVDGNGVTAELLMRNGIEVIAR
jgi:uncharacterized protein YbbK (DUF523 family)